MSSGSKAFSPLTSPPSAEAVALRSGPDEALIRQRIGQTQRQVKAVDVAAGLLALASGGLVWLLGVAAVDQWVFSGGLGFWGRLAALVGMVAAASVYIAVYVWPPVARRINPIFAAHTIEQSRPSLKNSLVNFLLLRPGQGEVSRPVFEAVTHQAATGLSGVASDTVVDRQHVIRLGYVFTGVVGVFALCLVLLSPRSLFTSAARMLLPWADILPPTRVQISDIQPGDTVAFLGQQLTISAEVDGLRRDEPVMVYYTTADRQSVDEAAPMTVPEGQYRHSCQVPPTSLGLQQDLEYRLAAGDFTSRNYRVEVRIAPTIWVERIEYEYPSYTGLARRVDQQQAEIKAIEGTRITVTAKANMPIDRAEIDLDCDGVGGVSMTAADQKATGAFTLRIREDDPTRPEHESYQICFTDHQGHADARPIRHRIEVIRDFPPTIELVDPPADQVELPENGALELRVRAQDPDFALRRVSLAAVRDGRSLSIRPLLAKPQPEKAHQGSFEGTCRFEPGKLGLKAGDRVEYRAVAEDNKEPVAGRSETELRRIVITAPRPHEAPQAGEKQQKPGEQKPGESATAEKESGESAEGSSQGQRAGQQPGKPSKEQQTGEKAQPQETGEQESQEAPRSSASKEEEGGQEGQGTEKSETGQSGRGQKQDQQKTETAQGTDQSKQPIDGATNPGDAFQEILKDRSQQQQQQGKTQPGEKSQGEQQGEGKPGQAGPGEKKSGASAEEKQPQGNQPSQGETREEGAGPQGAQKESGGERTGAKESLREPGAEGGGGEKPAVEASKQEPQGEGGRSEQQASSEKKPEGGAGEGGKALGGGQQKPKEGQAEKKAERPEARGGSPETAQGQAGAGKPSGEKESAGLPSPQEESRPRDKQLAERAKSQEQENHQESAKPRSNLGKQSDSQGEQGGERSGGGEEGGGQHAKQPGTGSAGANTAAEEGASQANQEGEGETGTQGGDRVAAERPTGGAQAKQAGGTKGESKADGQGATGKPEGQPEQGKGSGGEPGGGAVPPGATPQGQDKTGAGDQSGTSHVGGGKPGPQDKGASPPPEVEQQAEAANLEYARKQTVLALEYLKDQLAKEKPGVLDRLGWSREYAERFLRTWEQMERAAAQAGPQGDAAKRQLQDALRSLGLRRQGTELRGGGVETEELQHLRDAGRYEPPAEWAEQFRAYTKGVSSKK